MKDIFNTTTVPDNLILDQDCYCKSLIITEDGADFNTTGSLKVPVGTTAERPTGVAGDFRYNSTTGGFEGYTTEWGAIAGGGGGITTTASAPSANTIVYLDLGAAQYHELALSAGITTISCSNGTVGDSHVVVINQPSSGIATVGFDTYFEFPSGAAPIYVGRFFKGRYGFLCSQESRWGRRNRTARIRRSQLSVRVK